MSARPVLLIDDDLTWCEQVCRFLESGGYTVVTASTEAAALDSLDAMTLPSAILVEPNTADRAFRQALLARTELRGVPMFLVSAASAGEVYERGAGATGYVRKAVALDHLLMLLGTAPDDGASHRRAA